ncbi:hypothetical protein [Streptomyces sp. SID9124]|uniref:hypothetical protein n=1 Tax=Streptomyces sp. SID9124 TaxID=2706108 RepID=UPI0013E0CDBE|nr:hypothetical protein [Streptomyces sp. SID9124]NED14595.1 hypothetical protein [Streptomyces sp. SID9124]
MAQNWRAGILAGAMAFGFIVAGAPGAHAASGFKRVAVNSDCYVDVSITNDFTQGRVKGYIGAFCKSGSGTMVITPVLHIIRGTKHLPTKSTGARIVNKKKPLYLEVYTSNTSGKQCYRAQVIINHFTAGGTITKSGKTGCINV